MDYNDILLLQINKFFYEIILPPILVKNYISDIKEYNLNEVVKDVYSKKVDFIRNCFAVIGDVDEVYGTESSAEERFEHEKEVIQIIVKSIFSEFNDFLVKSLKPTAEA